MNSDKLEWILVDFILTCDSYDALKIAIGGILLHFIFASTSLYVHTV